MIYILLSSYNGEKYLSEQIESLLSQTYQNFKIIARDDHSSDRSLEILRSYGIEVVEPTENLGAKKSFSLLAEYAIMHDDCDYIMFCDQDDIWDCDKIEKTLMKIKELEVEYGEVPLLVYTDLEVVDEKLKLIDKSFFSYQRIFAKNINFHTLLMQNVITGCTILFNRKLAEIALPIPHNAIMHDWWLGLVASYFGHIGFLEEATLKYRQHGKNSLGAKGFNMRYMLNSMKKNHCLQQHVWQAKAFLDRYQERLDEESMQMLDFLSNLPQYSFFQKRVKIFKYQLFKHGWIRNIGIFFKI